MSKASPAYNQKVAITLYTLLGKAVWTIQHLEDALNRVIIIKNPEANTKTKADEILKSYRKLPLGRAIERAEKEQTFDDGLQERLKDFLQERNWLIHHCMYESADDVGYKVVGKDRTVIIAPVSIIEVVVYSFHCVTPDVPNG
ncbi:MAG: hypothetical protein KDJ75_06975 [Alphaproteobacteria bacterium]|nr:hypothetical protein [Alphaproteobacteria bacterium]